MANFEAYQEYQRIEDFEEDSPPGEEDLLVHVPEGLKGTQHSHVKKNQQPHMSRFKVLTIEVVLELIGSMSGVVFVCRYCNASAVFILQTHGTTSRTWITSSPEYPLPPEGQNVVAVGYPGVDHQSWDLKCVICGVLAGH